MDKLQKATDSLRQFCSQVGPRIFQEATVKAVDTAEYTADLVTDNGLELFECRLRAVAAGAQSIDVLPKIGSRVLVAKLEEDDYLVLACDEITSFRVVAGETDLVITQNGIVCNGGQLGGMVKVQELAAELNKTNLLVNAIKTVLTSWPVTPGDGGSALLLASQAALQPLSTGTFGANIENPNVKH